MFNVFTLTEVSMFTSQSMNNSIPPCGFKIDVVNKSIEALQGEKRKLAQELHELQRLRHLLEDDNENANVKLTQIDERHEKMLDALKVAARKAENVEAMSKNLEEIHANKAQKIHDIKCSIEKERDNLLSSMKEFEEQIHELSNMFISAKHFYSKENLTIKTRMLKQERQQKVIDTSELEEQIKTIRDQLRKVDTDKKRSTQENWDFIVTIFQEENRHAQKALEDVLQQTGFLQSME